MQTSKDKKSKPNTVKSTRRLLLFFSALFLVATIAATEYNILSTTIQQAFNLKLNAPDSTFNENLLTHRLINIDSEMNLVDKITKEKALSNVNAYLSKVRNSCLGKESETAYISCANDILSNYFAYQPSALTSLSYAKQVSDCDLNSYLIYDAARMKNIDISVVYAPVHAFVAYKEKGAYKYWDTVYSDQKGGLVDFSNQIYKKDFSPFYYRPQNEKTIIDTYKGFAFSKAKNQNIEDIITLSKDNPENVFLSTIKYTKLQDMSLLNKEDVTTIENSIQLNLTNTLLPLVLSEYYLANKEFDKARDYLLSMKKSDCGEPCFEIGSKLGLPIYKVHNNLYKLYSYFVEKQGHEPDEDAYMTSFAFLCVSIFFFFLYIITPAGVFAFMFIDKKIKNRRNKQ